MVIFAYLMLAALILSVIVLVWAGCELAKIDKERSANAPISSVEKITFPHELSRWEVNQVMRNIAKYDKQREKERSRRRRIIYS